MKKQVVIIIMMLVFVGVAVAQTNTFFTRTGHISFFSKMPMENIEAHNRQVSCMLDISSGSLAYKVLVKSFEFEKSLMQEHFNENYMQSEKYPKATFDGKINNISSINFKLDGVYDAEVEGDLEIHGVKKHLVQRGKIEVRGGKISTKATFTVALKDYNIKNDKVQNINENIQITVDVTMEPYQRTN